VCLVAFLVIVRWPREPRKASIVTEAVEIQTEEVPAEAHMTQRAVQEERLPQQWPSEEPEEVEADIVKTLQGRVTNIDPHCTMMLAVDGIGLDAGSVDLTGIRVGDAVEVTYRNEKYRNRHVNVVESVVVFDSSQHRTGQEVPPEEEPLRESAEALEWAESTEEESSGEPAPEGEREESTGEEPLRATGKVMERQANPKERPREGSEEALEREGLTQEAIQEPEEAVAREGPTAEEAFKAPEEVESDVPRTVQGSVTDYEHCTDTVTVDGIPFQPGSVDLTGIQIGDSVEITYTKNKYGKVLESIVVIERRH
jgi:hypothetical protein